MSHTTIHAPPAPIALSVPTDAAGLLADALGRIITGRPLPTALRPNAPPRPASGTVREGIERILAGRAGTTAGREAAPR